ncbi:MAG TPA: hypothetical protein VLK65_13205 [Vicinamibacteria bacterium]|nr:hypothetical protein [Vicinamibacteria bacterium]
MRTPACRVATLLAVLLAGSPLLAATEDLGTIDFPTSARSAEAQERFLRGVLLLHSFTFESAENAFKQALEAEPGFVMAYWGEALSHNHPLLAERDPELPRGVLKRLGATREERLAKAPTDRERGFLEAVEYLFGEGTEKERSLAYVDAMERLASAYPEDDEVRAFYAVSLLGLVRFGVDPDFRIRMKAGAIAEELFRKNPDHPGAAHYVIHAFDDPVHAPLALTAAYKYAEIAPDAAHALHMPSHIFIQHGMWERVSKSNDLSYDSAIRLWQKREDLSETERFYNDLYVWHALDWGQYGDLQLGDYEKAERRIGLLEPVAAKSKSRPAMMGPREMKARYTIETERWDARPIAEDATSGELLATALSAVRTGDRALAEKAEAKLEAMYEKESAERGEEATRVLAIIHKEVASLVRLAGGDGDGAAALMKEATAIAEAMRAPNGAATPAKPPNELYGEILLELGRPEEAKAAFERSLERMANRTLSLRGLARAAKACGDMDTARESYEKLARNLERHPDHPSYREATGFSTDNE